MHSVFLEKNNIAGMNRHAIHPCLSRQNDVYAVSVNDAVQKTIVRVTAAESAGSQHKSFGFEVALDHHIIFKITVMMVVQQCGIAVHRRPHVSAAVPPIKIRICHNLSVLVMLDLPELGFPAFILSYFRRKIKYKIYFFPDFS